MAYRLLLPQSAAIHDVFHVSQLKKALSTDTQVSPSLPDPDIALQFPEQILSKRLLTKGVHQVQQALIKWSGWPPSLATWEDLEALRQRFPAAPAWGQAASQQGGMSLPLVFHQLGLVVLLSPEWSRPDGGVNPGPLTSLTGRGGSPIDSLGWARHDPSTSVGSCPSSRDTWQSPDLALRVRAMPDDLGRALQGSRPP